MKSKSLWSLDLATLIPVFALYNIFVGLLLPDYSLISQHISELALEAPFFAYSHRFTNILIGISMCCFSLLCLSLARAWFTFLTMFAFGLTWIFAGIFILTSPLHDLYGLTHVLIVVPAIFALEMRNVYQSEGFQRFSILVTLAHVLFIWFLNYGFLPVEYKGISQRAWDAITLIWYGIAALCIKASIKRQNMSH